MTKIVLVTCTGATLPMLGVGLVPVLGWRGLNIDFCIIQHSLYLGIYRPCSAY